LDDNLKYPDVLNLDKNEVKQYLIKHNININVSSKNFKNPKNLLTSYEIVWERVSKKEALKKEAQNLL